MAYNMAYIALNVTAPLANPDSSLDTLYGVKEFAQSELDDVQKELQYIVMEQIHGCTQKANYENDIKNCLFNLNAHIKERADMRLLKMAKDDLKMAENDLKGVLDNLFEYQQEQKTSLKLIAMFQTIMVTADKKIAKLKKITQDQFYVSEIPAFNPNRIRLE